MIEHIVGIGIWIGVWFFILFIGYTILWVVRDTLKGVYGDIHNVYEDLKEKGSLYEYLNFKIMREETPFHVCIIYIVTTFCLMGLMVFAIYGADALQNKLGVVSIADSYMLIINILLFVAKVLVLLMIVLYSFECLRVTGLLDEREN